MFSWLSHRRAFSTTAAPAGTGITQRTCWVVTGLWCATRRASTQAKWPTQTVTLLLAQSFMDSPDPQTINCAIFSSAHGAETESDCKKFMCCTAFSLFAVYSLTKALCRVTCRVMAAHLQHYLGNRHHGDNPRYLWVANSKMPSWFLEFFTRICVWIVQMHGIYSIFIIYHSSLVDFMLVVLSVHY